MRPPEDDAAPLAGGAGVNDGNASPDHTRLPLTPPSHHSAPAGTSEVAAAQIADRAPTLRERVLAFIAAQQARGATDDEGESALGLKPQTYTPRRGELVKLGLVQDSGYRRKTASGCKAAVWVAVVHASMLVRSEGGAA